MELTAEEAAWLQRTRARLVRLRVGWGRPSPWGVVTDRGVRLAYAKTPRQALEFAMRRYDVR